jgi:hypothetical protein
LKYSQQVCDDLSVKKKYASRGSKKYRKLSSKEMRQLFGLEKIRQTILSHSHSSPATVEDSTALFYTKSYLIRIFSLLQSDE